MQRRVGHRVLVVVPIALVLAGCGGSGRSTYIDPNPDSVYAGVSSDGTSQPFSRHGADVAARAAAVLRLRSGLAAARAVQPSRPTQASGLVQVLVERDLPMVEPRFARHDRAAAGLRAGLELLAGTGAPPGRPRYVAAVQRVEREVDAAATSVIPPAARADDGFHAAVLVEAITEASSRYEDAFLTGDGTDAGRADYQMVYGTLLQARTAQLRWLPAADRASIRTRLQDLATRATPTPTVPTDLAAEPQQLATEIADLADLVARAAGVEATFPAPEPESVDQLRLLQRAVAQAIERWEGGQHSAARSELEAAYDAHLLPAAPGVASVDVELLARIEHLAFVELPAAMGSGNGDPADRAVALDEAIDEAASVVAQELELLRDADR